MAANIRQGQDGLWYVNSIPCASQSEAMERLKTMDPESYAQIVGRAQVATGERAQAIGSWLIILCVLGLIIWVAFKLFSPKPPEVIRLHEEQRILANMQVRAEGFVKLNLKDPESATFRNQRGACGEVNAKNSFGGFIGYRRYIAANEALVLIEGDTVPPDQFSELWRQSCN